MKKKSFAAGSVTAEAMENAEAEYGREAFWDTMLGAKDWELAIKIRRVMAGIIDRVYENGVYENGVLRMEFMRMEFMRMEFMRMEFMIVDSPSGSCQTL